MKLKHAAVLLAASFLAACGGGKQEGVVTFIGFTPVTVNDKDIRTVQTNCPGCGDPIAVDTARCPNKKCKTDMTWPKDYRCPSCQGSGVCAACTAMEQTKGECYNCRGTGVLIYAGQSPNCPNCKGSKQCPICKGTRKCDQCNGEKVISKEIVKAKAAKFVSKDGDLPDSDPRPPDTKKPDAEKKEEPKKEGGSTEEKK
ncbi:MAG: hypothetical protein HY293_10450 [Planctomycetes bacterium]|nr:hypothetical protein [Planctomycetota bacterium]